MVEQNIDSMWDSLDFLFEQTQWTKIQDPNRRHEIQTELYERYRNPLYSYLRHKKFSINPEQAKDYVQQFFLDKIFSQEFITRAHPNRGKFRNFLMTALSHHVIDDLRKKKREKISFSLDEDYDRLDDSAEDPEVAFGRAWADQVLEQVLNELKEECRQNQKLKDWRLFYTWFLDSTTGKGKIRMQDLCAETGKISAKKGFQIIEFMKKRLGRILRNHFLAEGLTEEDVEEEIKRFIQLFSKSSRKKS